MPNVPTVLRFQASLPLNFWGECALTAAYLINKTPSELLDGKILYVILFQKKPSYDHIKVFDSLCYAKNQFKAIDKFASRSRRCIFVGYSYGKKPWKLYDLETNEFFESRDVIFYEGIFPFKDGKILAEHLQRTEVKDNLGPTLHTRYDEDFNPV